MKLCKNCGHSKREHNPQSENYDAEAPCDHPDCNCLDFVDYEIVEDLDDPKSRSSGD